MLTPVEIVSNDAENEKYLLSNVNDFRYLSSILSSINCRRGIFSFFLEKNIFNAKQCFYVCGLLDAFRVKTYQDRLFDYDLNSIGYAMLSDNLPFVKDVFAKLTYQGTYLEDITRNVVPITMEDNVLAGEGAIFNHTVQQFLLGNKALIERNLTIMERVYFNETNQNSTLQYDVAFFKALYQEDSFKCRAILKEMVTPKVHQKRNDDALLKKYISMPALGYAKLAWILGMEIDVDSKFVPRELLPVQSLDRYEIPYEFLRQEFLNLS